MVTGCLRSAEPAIKEKDGKPVRKFEAEEDIEKSALRWPLPEFRQVGDSGHDLGGPPSFFVSCRFLSVR